MSEALPDFVDRLKRNFGSSYTLGQHEQDFTSTRQYGGQFVEAIEKSIRTGHSKLSLSPSFRKSGSW